jgi:hypothetical protein
VPDRFAVDQACHRTGSNPARQEGEKECRQSCFDAKVAGADKEAAIAMGTAAANKKLLKRSKGWTHWSTFARKMAPCHEE